MGQVTNEFILVTMRFARPELDIAIFDHHLIGTCTALHGQGSALGWLHVDIKLQPFLAQKLRLCYKNQAPTAALLVPVVAGFLDLTIANPSHATCTYFYHLIYLDDYTI